MASDRVAGRFVGDLMGREGVFAAVRRARRGDPLFWQFWLWKREALLERQRADYWRDAARIGTGTTTEPITSTKPRPPTRGPT